MWKYSTPVVVGVDGSDAATGSSPTVIARCSLSADVMSTHDLAEPATAELVDGSVIALRQLEPHDTDAIRSLYESLTDQERYFRFFAMHPAHLDEWARSIAEPRTDQVSLGAFSSGRLLGVANYVACQDPDDAEVAVVMAHAEHLRGVGLRCCAGSDKSREKTACIVSLPMFFGKTTSCFGCFRTQAGLARDTLMVRCFMSRSTSAWSNHQPNGEPSSRATTSERSRRGVDGSGSALMGAQPIRNNTCG
jgi:hypothetical protein